MFFYYLISNVLKNRYKMVDKKWGKEVWLVNKEYCGKLLIIEKKKRCSIHHHKKKAESFLLISGQVLLQYGGERKLLRAGDIVDIPVNTIHRFTGITELSEMMEFSTHHEENDSYRTTESGEVPDQEWTELLALCNEY
jgi:quercetin dioxygenase-like cupin family protein